ncbi:hypothetical protein TCAL_08559, partial [Tigriopus californicus]
DEVFAESLISDDLHDHIRTVEDTIVFLAKRRLLANSSFCDRCEVQRELRPFSRCIDTVHWKCPRCRTTRSIRKYSFFSNSMLHFQQILKFTYGWARDWPLKEIASQSGGMASTTRVDWANFHRDVCQEYINTNQTQIGGIYVNAADEIEPEVVEKDESLIAKAKYNRGRWPEARWIFGGIERRTGACFMVEDPDRTRETLEEAIVENIRPGTHIVSDRWASFTHLEEIDGRIYSQCYGAPSALCGSFGRTDSHRNN